MADTPGKAAPDAIAELQSRSAALRKAAANPRAGDRALLDAALTELDAAIGALAAATGSSAGREGNGSGAQPDRRLLQAIFGQTPVPLLVVDGEGIIRRANIAACELLGVGPGYATGRNLTSMIESGGHAPMRSQLAAVRRTRSPASADCVLLTADGEIACALDIRMLEIRGDDDRLLLVLRPGGAPESSARQSRGTQSRGKQKSADESPIRPCFCWRTRHRASPSCCSAARGCWPPSWTHGSSSTSCEGERCSATSWPGPTTRLRRAWPRSCRPWRRLPDPRRMR
jgi:PAS domain S-box-containing protein